MCSPSLRLDLRLPGDALPGDRLERLPLGKRPSHPPEHPWSLLFASRLHQTVALSFGDAELNAQVVGMTEGPGV